MKDVAAPLAAFGLGGAGIGNLYRAVSDLDAYATVHAALANGFGLIDTAPYYGHGLSEMRVGAALSAWQGARPQLSSKVGRLLDPAAGPPGDFGFADPAPFTPRFDYSRDGVRRSLDESLERLRVDKLDVALVHDVGAATHGGDHPTILRQVLDETLPALREAQSAGRVGRVGIGVNEWQVSAEILERAPLDVILIAGRYTLLEQPALTHGLLDLCLSGGTQVLAAGVFNSGLLATRPDADSTYNYGRAPDDIVARARALWAACEAYNVAPQAAALKFPMLHAAVRGVVVGARSVHEVEQINVWRQADIPDGLWADLKRRGFIASDAPCA